MAKGKNHKSGVPKSPKSPVKKTGLDCKVENRFTRISDLVQSYPKVLKNGQKVVKKWSQNDPKIAHKWSKNGLEMNQNGSKRGLKMTQK